MKGARPAHPAVCGSLALAPCCSSSRARADPEVGPSGEGGWTLSVDFLMYLSRECYEVLTGQAHEGQERRQTWDQKMSLPPKSGTLAPLSPVKVFETVKCNILY